MKDNYYTDHSNLSNSMLSTLASSPELFHAKYIERSHPDVDSPAMKFGRLFHLMATTPEQIAAKYIAAPKVDRRTKEGKAAYSEFCESVGDREIVDIDDVFLAELLTRRIWTHDQMIQLVGVPADFEVPLTFELDGVPMKCRPDAVYHGPRIVVDFKTTQDASPDGFKKSVFNFGYDRQAWIYREALRQVTGNEYRFLFAAVEKEFPHRVGVYELAPRTLFAAENAVYRLLSEYKARAASNNWKSNWTSGVELLELDGWMDRKRELLGVIE